MASGSDIADYLETNGLGTVGTDIFIGYRPDTPDDNITIYETGGFAIEKAGFINYPTIQIQVRNKRYSTGRTKIDNIVNLLHRTTNTTINDTVYSSIYAANDVISLGKDDQQRNILSVNFEITTLR